MKEKVVMHFLRIRTYVRAREAFVGYKNQQTFRSGRYKPTMWALDNRLTLSEQVHFFLLLSL